MMKSSNPEHDRYNMEMTDRGVFKFLNPRDKICYRLYMLTYTYYICRLVVRYC